MTINILFNEEISWMEGSFRIHRKNYQPIDTATRISELGESLRYELKDTGRDYWMPLKEITHVEILKYRDIKSAR